MKKQILLILAFFVATLAAPAFADTETVNGIEWEYVLMNSDAHIQGISGNIPIHLEIPATLGGCPVKDVWNWDCFANCPDIVSLSFPACYEFDLGPFANLPELANYHVSPDHPDLKSIDGVIFSKDGTTLVAYPRGRTGSYVVPDGTTQIGEEAFSDCSLSEVTIPAGVVQIGGGAFEYCQNLTKVVLPNSLGRIEYDTFYGCHIKDLTLPGYPFEGSYFDFSGRFHYDDAAMGSVTNISIAEGAVSWNDNDDSWWQLFEDWTSLESIRIPSSMVDVSVWYAFGDYGITVEIADGNPAYKIENGSVFSKDGKTLVRRLSNRDPEYVVPNGVETILGGAFGGAPAASIVLPDSVTSIGIDAFFMCTNLTDLTIPASVTNIGMAAFQMCTSLTNLTIPASVERLDARDMFSGCRSLKDLTILCPAAAFVEDSWGYGTFGASWGYDGTIYDCDIETIRLPTSFYDKEGTTLDHYRFESMVYGVEIVYFGPVEISFDPAGGTVDTPKVIRQFGEPYGELPVPRRRGYTFKYWKPYEHSSRGIESTDIVVNSDHIISSQTLVAEWQENLIPTIQDILGTSTANAAGIIGAAIDNAGFADADGVKAAIGGDFAKYAEFREWAQGVEGGETAVIASPNAAASFQLGAGRLFDSAPVITFEDVSIAGEDAGVPAMTVTVAVHDGDDIAAVAAEKVAEMFEATSSLGDWDGDAKLIPTVIGITRNADGTMTFTVVPGDGSAKSAFLRIRAN